MVTCVVPIMASEDSDALVGTTPGMSLNTNSAVLYLTGGDSSIDLEVTQMITGDDEEDVYWGLNDLDDGTSFVSLVDNQNGTYTVTALSIPNNQRVASVEVYACVDVVDGNGDPVIDPTTQEQVKHTASAVIVVYPSPTTTATTFHYFFKIDESAIDYLVEDEQIDYETLILPDLSDDCDIFEGFWITVTYNNDMGMTASQFNALSALQWYLDENDWENDFGYYGWINTLLGLGSYMGPANGDGNVWYYWAQYHATGNGSSATWVFNNTTLEFITTAEESYIGMIFWGSPDANTVPAPFPGYPVA